MAQYIQCFTLTSLAIVLNVCTSIYGTCIYREVYSQDLKHLKLLNTCIMQKAQGVLSKAILFSVAFICDQCTCLYNRCKMRNLMYPVKCTLIIIISTSIICMKCTFIMIRCLLLSIFFGKFTFRLSDNVFASKIVFFKVKFAFIMIMSLLLCFIQ